MDLIAKRFPEPLVERVRAVQYPFPETNTARLRLAARRHRLFVQIIFETNLHVRSMTNLLVFSPNEAHSASG
jgi:hypothetical protein